MTEQHIAVAEFARAKLDFLDAFAGLEIQVGFWLALLGQADTAKPFGQRLQSLIDHPQLATQATPSQLDRIRQLPDDCRSLLRLRNFLVHSQFAFCLVDGEATIFLRTLSLSLVDKAAVLPVTTKEVRDTTTEVKKLAGSLALWLAQKSKVAPKRASSPPPPSPDAAGGP